MNEVHVNGNATGIDNEVGFPLLLYLSGDRESGQKTGNFHFRFHVLRVVLFEEPPLVRIVMRIIARPATVGLCGLAGDAEITDQGLAGVQLLLVLRDAQRPARRIKARGITGIQAVQHSVTELCHISRGKIDTEMPSDTPRLKGRIVGHEYAVIAENQVFERCVEVIAFLWNSQVEHANRSIVNTVGAQKDFKRRALNVPERTGFFDADVGICFKVKMNEHLYLLCVLAGQAAIV